MTHRHTVKTIWIIWMMLAYVGCGLLEFCDVCFVLHLLASLMKGHVIWSPCWINSADGVDRVPANLIQNDPNSATGIKFVNILPAIGKQEGLNSLRFLCFPKGLHIIVGRGWNEDILEAHGEGHSKIGYGEVVQLTLVHLPIDNVQQICKGLFTCLKGWELRGSCLG